MKQQFTAPYTPQENPTERANRTIKTIIAQFSSDRHNRWDELLPEVMLALNTSVSESTGYSPAFLTQGRNPRLPKALYDDVTIGSGARCVSPEERANELKEIFKIVTLNLEKASQKQRHHYNLRHRGWTPRIGDHVLVRQHPLSKAIDSFTAKLAPKFKGPFVIIEFVSPVIVQVRAVGESEKLTVHISELKPYYSNNPSFSLISSRLLNSTRGRHGGNMESNQKKFERTREKFRRNLQRASENTRRTVFIDDDEVPGTSKSRPFHNRQRPTASSPKMANNSPEKATGARHFRMTVVTPPQSEENKPSQAKFRASASPPERKQPDYDCVYISGDETPPPPPPLWEEEDLSAASTWIKQVGELLGEGSTTDQPCVPTEERFEFDGLELTHEELDDPFITECYRSFWGAFDTTVDIRPPTPPSPPASSTSSLDWESENFRPPTPPKRRGFVDFEVQDHQYHRWGMRCYERIWRARIMTPTATTTCPITGNPQQSHEQSLPPGRASHSSQSDHHDGLIQETSNREWVDSSTYVHQYPDQQPLEYHNTSPVPSPPPIFSLSLPSSPIPTGTPLVTIPDHPPLEELPEEVRKTINTALTSQPGRRLRFRQVIWGYEYRITINRSGEVTITRV